jgi:hypothetical protein
MLLEFVLTTQSIPILASCISLAVMLKTQPEETKQSVMLLGLVDHTLGGETAWQALWPLFVRLQTDLKAALPPEEFVTAWERGQSLDLDTTARALLAELESDTND